jgi:hypothetical protein
MTGTAARLVAMACLMLAMGVTRANSQMDRQASARSARNVMVGCEALLGAKDSELDAYWQGGCGGEVLEAWDTGTALKLVCTPHEVILNEVVRIVVQYIAARPERMDERFSTLALEALRATWPCK